MEEIRADEWAGDARDISGRRRLAWSKNQRQNPITRAQTTALVTRLRDQTIPQLTAKLARRKLAEIQPSQGAPAQTIVDGREGAPLDSVRSGGRIVFRFADLGPVLDWIWEQLVTRSPVGGLGGASCGLRRCTASSASWR
jgi:hypothetical protein